MKSSGFAIPAAPSGYGPSSRARKDGRPQSFQQHGNMMGVDAYVPAATRERIAQLQQQQLQLQRDHQREWGHTTQPYAQHAHAQTAWRSTPTPPPQTPPTTYQQQQPLHSVAYAQSFAGYNEPNPLPPPSLQPRPPPPPSASQLASQYQQQQRKPPSAAFHQPPSRVSTAGPSSSRRASSTVTRQRDGSVSPPLSPPSHTAQSTPAKPVSSTSASTGHGAPSLQDQVSAALADLESIKTNRYRPSTAAASTSSVRDSALPRPQIRSSGTTINANNPSNDTTTSRTQEELRLAKTILKKLYKKNVQLAKDIKLLRAGQSIQSGSPKGAGGVNDSLQLDEQERKLLMQPDGTSSTRQEDSDGEDEIQRPGDDAGEEDESDLGSPTRRRPRTSSTSSKRPGTNAGSSKLDLGGSSHLLFLLGERDTTINKLQAQVQSLTRKVNSYAGRLEVAGGTGASSTSTDQGSEGLFSDTGSEVYQSQLQTLRQNFADKLHSQLTQLQQVGEPLSRRVLAYIQDLEKWIVWEASWRQVEKTALNAQCMKAEKQAQESWVRSRLLEREVHDIQQRYNTLDSKMRVTETQLSASLERNRQMEQEIIRNKNSK